MWKFVVLICLSLAWNASAQSIAYYQNFPGTGSSGSVVLGSYNWNADYGNSSTNTLAAVSGMGSSVPNGQVSNGGTAPSSSPNVNAGAPPSSSVAEGAAFIATPNNTYQYVLSTNEFAINNPTQFQWYAAGDSGDKQQLAVEIGTQWFASTTLISISVTTTPASALPTNAIKATIPFNPNAAAWDSLSFAVGTPLVLGSTPTALPSGNVDGFGVYIVGSGGSDHAFVDSFEVDSTPEPTSLSLLMLGISAAVLRRRR